MKKYEHCFHCYSHLYIFRFVIESAGSARSQPLVYWSVGVFCCFDIFGLPFTHHLFHTLSSIDYTFMHVHERWLFFSERFSVVSINTSKRMIIGFEIWCLKIIIERKSQIANGENALRTSIDKQRHWKDCRWHSNKWNHICLLLSSFILFCERCIYIIVEALLADSIDQLITQSNTFAYRVNRDERRRKPVFFSSVVLFITPSIIITA